MYSMRDREEGLDEDGRSSWHVTSLYCVANCYRTTANFRLWSKLVCLDSMRYTSIVVATLTCKGGCAEVSQCTTTLEGQPQPSFSCLHAKPIYFR